MAMAELTAAQERAIRHPCLLAVETANPAFTHRIWDKIVRLTVNTGYE